MEEVVDQQAQKNLGPSGDAPSGTKIGVRRVMSFNMDTAFASLPSPTISACVAERMSNEELLRMMDFTLNDTTSLPSSEGHMTPDGLPGDVVPNEMGQTTESLSFTKVAILMVGLPARGKTHVARKLLQYMNWLGFNTKIFNVGNYRRDTLGAYQPASFFSADNPEGMEARTKLAETCLRDMVAWLTDTSNAHVGIYDATNATIERRLMLRTRLEACGFRTLFLESVCNDESIIQNNLMQTKLFSPDYKDSPPAEAIRDFNARIAEYEKVYETLSEDEQCSFIKTINVGQQLVVNQITGYVPGKIMSYLLNTHIMERDIYLSRHGESLWNVLGKLGGDPSLSARGHRYAYRLKQFVQEEFTENGRSLPLVWTSQLQRTRQTVTHIPTVHMCWRALNEIDAGVCEGMTYAQVREQMPHVAEARSKDKLRFRYPGGESYVDVIHRLEPVILELERQRESVLLVAHNAVIRAIYAFYMSMSRTDATTLDIPLHHVFKLSARAYGCELTVFDLSSDVDLSDNLAIEGT